MKNLLSKFIDNKIFFLFFLPLLPHIELGVRFIQLDDIPVLIFFILFFLDKKDNLLEKLKEVNYLFLFLIYIILQNFFISPESINTEIIRFLLYLFVFIEIKNNSNELVFKYSKKLFYFLAFFSIFSYLFSLNLGTDSYNYWNIGLNENRWLFTKGRVNGFQAGGPNSFGDLLVVLGLFTFINSSEKRKPFILILSFLSCFFTYSRSSLLVLSFFVIVFLIIEKFNFKFLMSLFFSVVISINFGLVDRFSSEKETEGISDRVEMQSATVNYLSSSKLQDLIFGNGNQKIGVVNNSIGNIDEFSEDLRVTGPHNSYLFFVLKYGLLGTFLLSILIFSFLKKLFYKGFRRTIYHPVAVPILSVLILGLASDLLHNHSVSWIIYLYLAIYEK
jgi:O-antigen ligase